VADGRPGGGLWALTVANARLMARLADSSNVYVIDTQRLVSGAGGQSFNEQLWFAGKLLFDDAVLERAAAEIRAGLAAIAGDARKLVVLDLDNTLWGGVIGDVGRDHLILGGHDSAGEGYLAFQEELLRLKHRGILLAVVSKNDEDVALAGIDGHESMLLRSTDLVAWRINWDDKAQNIADLVSELDLGLQSVAFIDDSPYERARVRDGLPEVLVPEWPANPVNFRQALSALTCFDSVGTSTEDRNRTEMYATERERQRSLSVATSNDEWVEQLDVVLSVAELSPASIVRATQLLNKTNQMNLTTRRLSEQEYLDWSGATHRRSYVVSVADRLGDSGLTGLVSVEVDGETGQVVDFVLSCRVMGRRVEEAMLSLAAEAARDLGAVRLIATVVATEKNAPCQQFFASSAMTVIGEHEHELGLPTEITFPSTLRRGGAG